MHDLYLRVRALVQFAEACQLPALPLSTKERLAIALVLDRPDLVQDEHHTVLSAIARIGTDWTQAAFAVQRDGWRIARPKASEAARI